MAGTTTTYGDINQRTAAVANRTMLKHAQPKIVLSKMAKQIPFDKNTANAMKLRRPKPFPVSTIPLVEGVTPTPQKLQYEDVAVNLKQYGNVIEFTDHVIDTSEDNVLRDASELAGEQAGGTMEQVAYAAVRGGTNVFYANGAVRTAVNTAISLNKQRAVTRALARQKAQKITKIIDSTPSFNTTPVEAAYVAVAHTDVESDIRNMAGFIPVAKYGSKRVVDENEIGSVESVRYVLTEDLAPFADAGGAAGSMVSTTGTNADVYPVIFFGQDAWAITPLKGSNQMTPMVVNPKPSIADPLAQRGTVGYKFTTAAVITNELWLARLEVAVTKL